MLDCILEKQGHQNPYIHPTGWLSREIYLKVVPTVGKCESAIEFSLNSKHYYDVNSPCVTFKPTVGDMVFSVVATSQDYSFHSR